MAVELLNQLQQHLYLSPLSINFLVLHFPTIKLLILNTTNTKRMELFVPLSVVLAMTMVIAAPAKAQVTTPCNASMINSVVNPCMNYLTNSTSNGTSSPTAQCCNSIKSLTGTGMDCLCLIVTGNLPFTIPINRTLAISLPRACNLPRVPLQCKSMYIHFQSLFSYFVLSICSYSV